MKDKRIYKSKKINVGITLLITITTNGQSLLLCWYFIMSSPEPLLIEKLKLKLTTKS
jgi:hypothetical protein